MGQKIHLLFILFLCSYCVGAQNQIEVNALVFDRSSNKPMQYVNVGFIGEQIGTVTDQDGFFSITYNSTEVDQDAILQLSSLGYYPLRLTQKKLKELLNKTEILWLSPKRENIEEVLVKSIERKEKLLGVNKINPGVWAYWKDKLALGAEIATQVKIKKEGTKLLNLKYKVTENQADSLRVRVNIYKLKEGLPENNILTRNIYHIIKTSKDWGEIDLSPYNIYVNDDVVVSLEMIEVYGDILEFAIATGKGRTDSYTRLVSQDNWKKWNNLPIAFTVNASYPLKENELLPRENPKTITLYWDVSSSMGEQNKAEFSLLEKYLAKTKANEIKVITFSNTIHDTKVFNLKSTRIEEVKDFLFNLKYEGSTNFSVLDFNSDSDVFLLYTDGNGSIGTLPSSANKPVFILNSSQFAAHQDLQNLAYWSEGDYINLYFINEDQALSKMVNLVDENNEYNNSQNNNLQTVSGIVTMNETPVEGVRVGVEGTLREAITDDEGNYSLPVDFGENIVYEFFTAITKKVNFEGQSVLNLQLKPKYQTLDKTTVEFKKSENQEEKVATGYGRKLKRSLGYATYSLNYEDFPKSAIYLSDILRRRFPGVQVFGFGADASYRVRGNSSIKGGNDPLFIVDGLTFTSPPNFININTIDNINVIKGLAGLSRWGSLARNGVILITTKIEMHNKYPDLYKKPSALVTGNDYEESPLRIDFVGETPVYLKPLENATNFEEAQAIYTSMRDKNKNDIWFYEESAHILKRWDKELASRVLSNIAEIGLNNPKALRTLAYKYDTDKNYDAALDIYKKILELEADRSQSYIDLAQAYYNIQDFTKSFEYYKQILDNNTPGVKFSDEIIETAEIELKHLVTKHKDKVDYKSLPPEFLEKAQLIDTYVVFEWNDSQAEFDLQFVNPDKKYFTWSHTAEAEHKRIKKEISEGVNSKMFTIENSQKGPWIINIENKDLIKLENNPVYIKYTLYKNYGRPEEVKKEKVIKLYKYEDKVNLDRIVI